MIKYNLSQPEYDQLISSVFIIPLSVKINASKKNYLGSYGTVRKTAKKAPKLQVSSQNY